MRCSCVNLPKGTDVLPRLQDSRDGPSAGLGDNVSPDALLPYVLLQLLVSLAGTGHRAFMESGKLQRAPAENGLLADAAALHVDRGARNAVFSPAGISAGLFSFVLCGQEKRSAVSVGDYSVVGQLSGQGLRVEDDPGFGWRAQHAAAVCASHPASPRISAL